MSKLTGSILDGVAAMFLIVMSYKALVVDHSTFATALFGDQRAPLHSRGE